MYFNTIIIRTRGIATNILIRMLFLGLEAKCEGLNDFDE